MPERPRCDVVILGRAGSRGLPGKNALAVAGRPMVAWTIDHARASSCARRIVCSTDGAAIADAARAGGVEVIERPAELAGDTAAVADAARHAVLAADLDAEVIAILYANVPVRPAGLLDRAVEALAAGGDSAQSYADVGKHHPWWMVELDAGGRVVPQRERVPDRRQDLPPLHLPDGGVIAVRREVLVAARPVTEGGHPHDFLGTDRRGIATDDGAVVDVDDVRDLRVAEATLAGPTTGAGSGSARDRASDPHARLLGRDLSPAGADVLVIAEIGVNHDGDTGRAVELAHAAVEAGADAVKLQHFVPERLMSRAARLAAYQAAAGETDPLAMLRRLALPLDDLLGVAARVRAAGALAVVTLFSPGDADELRAHVGAGADAALPPDVPLDALKTASPDLVNRPLVEALLGLGRPLVQSTGAASTDEVRRAAAFLDARAAAAPDGVEAVLMHCVSAYPVPADAAALGGLAALRAVTSRAVGYSDHTESEDTGALAVAAGARLLEKHVTLDRGAAGPDHAASLEPVALARYVAAARAARRAVGPIEKAVLPVERDVRRASRQSVVLAADRPAGHRLVAGDLQVKRPGTGVPAERLAELVGRTLVRAVPADEPVAWEDVGLAAPAPRPDDED